MASGGGDGRESVDEAWARLRRHLDRADKFWFGVVLTVDVNAGGALRERMEFNRRRVLMPTLVLDPATPAELADLVDRIETEGCRPRGCTWIQAIHVTDVSRREGELTWDQAWTQLLQRLNHRRNALRGRLGGLVLVMTPTVRPVAQRVSSDLWSILDFLTSVRPPAQPLDADVIQRRDGGDSTNISGPGEAPDYSAALPLSGLDLSGERSPEAHDRLLALLALPEDDVVGAAAARFDQTVDEAVARGDHSAVAALLLVRGKARRAARDAAGARDDFMHLLPEATHVHEAPGSPGRLEAFAALTDLASEAGDWVEALGWAEQARRLSEEGARAGSVPGREWLAFALNNVGRVREARGDASGAEEVFARSLAIREELAARVGTPQASRDLSVALDNVGRVREARGDASGAREALHRAALLLNGLVDAGTIEAGDEARLADIQHRLSRLSA